jgi:hypothetical protein
MKRIHSICLSMTVVFSVACSQAFSQVYRTILYSSFGTGSTNPSTSPASDILPGATSYTAQTGSGSTTDGNYSVVNATRGYSSLWIAGAPDHTTGDVNGYMMLINANPAKKGQIGGTYFLYTTSAFDIPGAEYAIDFWAANLLQNSISTTVYKNSMIGLAVSPSITNASAAYSNSSWTLARSASNTALAWENHNLPFTLPLSYTGAALYFNFYNSDNDLVSNTNGNDLVLDDITIKIRVSALSGTVFNDLNGNGIKDGSETGINGSTTPLYAYIVKTDGTVMAKVAVSATGTYSFNEAVAAGTGVPYIASNQGLKVLYSTANVAVGGSVPAAVPPAGYGILRENVSGNTTGGAVDNTSGDGIINLTNTSTDKTNLNFAVNALPEAYPENKFVSGKPVLTNLSDIPLEGRDPVDQPVKTSWSGRSVILNPPSNGFILKYNGTVVTSDFPVANYNPALLTIEPGPSTPGNVTATVFTYKVVDGVGLQSSPVNYTVSYATSLPVVFGTIEANLSGSALTVNWQAVSELNNDHYEIEASYDGTNFIKIGEVKTQVPGGNSEKALQYSFTKTLPGQLAGIGLCVLALTGFLFNKRSRVVFALIMLTSVIILNTGCTKKGDDVSGYTNQDVFVRIKQTDKDGTTRYSQVVQAIRK